MAGQNYYNIPPPPPPPNQAWNNPIPDCHPQFGHNTVPHSRLNMPSSMPYPNLPIISDPHPPSITPMMTHPRSNLDRPFSSSSSNFHPECHIHNTFNRIPNNHFPTNYNSEAGPSNRVTLKRKNPEVQVASSYSSPVEARNWRHPVEDTQRNVRSRHSHMYNASPNLDANNNNPDRNYVPISNVVPQPLLSHPNLNGRNNFSSYLPPPQSRNITDPGSYNYDLNHGHHARNNIPYLPQNRIPSVPVTTHHRTMPLGTVYENTTFAPRVDHHGPRQSYVASSASARWRQPGTECDASSSIARWRQPDAELDGSSSSRWRQPGRELAASSASDRWRRPGLGFDASSASARWRQPCTEFDASSSSARWRQPVISSDAGSNSVRIRNPDSGFRAFHVEHAPNRWLLEHFGSADGPMVFDSTDLFDQHRDMRLDIDNMSYEELLALEERIGNVNVGLHEEKISKCLKEFTYSTCNQSIDQEPASCVICLDLYEEGDEVGKLKCAHEFHTNCIKKWLEMKNTCPVCKSAASEDTC